MFPKSVFKDYSAILWLMVLDKATVEKIKDAVKSRPRTINEIADILGTSWKTADRHVSAIFAEDGSIASHTFRQGTRGALKIVYWLSAEQPFSEAQKIIFERLVQGKKKEDFSPLDIFQFADREKRKISFFDSGEGEQEIVFRNFVKILGKAEESVSCFSGNISWINSAYGREKAVDLVQGLAESGVKFKILARVELPSIKNLETLFTINRKIGDDAILLMHCEQPLRGFIIDGKIVLLKESKAPEYYKKGELEKKTVIFYQISDKKWVDWAQNVFRQFWQNSFDAQKRLESLKLSSQPRKI